MGESRGFHFDQLMACSLCRDAASNPSASAFAQQETVGADQAIFMFSTALSHAGHMAQCPRGHGSTGTAGQAQNEQSEACT